jgi:ubiquinone/menaquinone biosynthesis C-methylase UbiE
MMAGMDRLEYYRVRYRQLNTGWMHATARYQALVARTIQPGFNILDLGCGRGGVVERLGDTGRWLGIDPDWLSLKGHRRPVLQRGCADAARLPVAKHSFDIVVSSWVLEHLPEPERVFDEISRVLKPGGHFFFLTPNAKHPIPWLSRKLTNNLVAQRAFVQRLYDRTPVDTYSMQYQANTWERIDQLAVQSGLQLVEVELVKDPSYLAWNTLTFILAIVVESLLPASWNVHIVGHYALCDKAVKVQKGGNNLFRRNIP